MKTPTKPMKTPHVTYENTNKTYENTKYWLSPHKFVTYINTDETYENINATYCEGKNNKFKQSNLIVSCFKPQESM